MTRGSYTHTPEHNKKISTARMGNGNGMYRASKKKDALHVYMRRRIPKPEFCEICHEKPPYDLANVSQKYKRKKSDWVWLCRSCHMDSDGRKHNLKHDWPHTPPTICKNCGQLKKHYGLGLCHHCYDKQRWLKRKLTYKEEPYYLKRKNHGR